MKMNFASFAFWADKFKIQILLLERKMRCTSEVEQQGGKGQFAPLLSLTHSHTTHLQPAGLGGARHRHLGGALGLALDLRAHQLKGANEY